MKIAIVGAGAAGCFAAANIPSRPGLEVTVYEKTGKALQKVKVSGGGRCNVTHHLFDTEAFAERYPRGRQLLRKNLHHFGPADTINWFQSRGVALKAEPDGRMFPVSNESQSIIDCIRREMEAKGVQLNFNKALLSLKPLEEGFELTFTDGSTAYADRVLIASGGYPKEEQYQWLKDIPQTIEAPVPSLFTFNLPGHAITELMGVAAPVTIKIAGTKIREQGPMLITHWGLSGPAVLRCSAWAARELQEKNYQFSIVVNWLPDYEEESLKEKFKELRSREGKQSLSGKNSFGLPKRLWEYLIREAGITDATRWGDLPATAQNKLLELLLRHVFSVKGKTTFKEEFVTCGGIKLKDIDPATMQSRKHPGLYFAGEVTDVDGITGGFNFQNAWTAGFLVAQSIATVSNRPPE